MATRIEPPAPDAPGAETGTETGLDGLVPRAGPGFVRAFVLAALRRDGRAWLGAARLRLLAAALSLDEKAALAWLDRPPRPPPVLGDAAAWIGRRLPLLHEGRVAWPELFWRPDPREWRRGAGAFALRLPLPGAGTVEIRGRIEEGRLDAVLHANGLSRLAAYEAREAFALALRPLGLEGGLVVRTEDG